MGKRIAVLVRDRQGEALRMAVGLTLVDDTVDVYVLDGKIEDTQSNATNIETMEMMELDIYTNCRENEGLEYLSTEEIARKLLEYDGVVPY